MPRRVNLPGADELFRSTAEQNSAQRAQKNSPADLPAEDSADRAANSAAAVAASGRVKHDEKMTVYVTSDELIALEQARLELRSLLRRKVDRGRLVRAAIAVALADLSENGAESDVARRLMDS